MKAEIMWAIFGRNGLYTGTFLTRKEAVKSHCTDLWKSWEDCKKDGDRAVRVSLRIIRKQTPSKMKKHGGEK